MSPVKDPSAYPPAWPEIRERILERAGNRCECTSECGRAHGSELDTPNTYERCVEVHRRPGLEMNGLVVLTCAHLDHEAAGGDHSDGNLKALCQRCHLRFDGAHRRRKKKEAEGGEQQLDLLSASLAGEEAL